MTEPSSTINKLGHFASSLQSLTTDTAVVDALRAMHHQLTASPFGLNGTTRDLVEFHYNQLSEDILRSFAEDVSVPTHTLAACAVPLAGSLLEAADMLSIEDEEHLKLWFSAMKDFMATYRHLVKTRRDPQHIDIEGVKFLVATDDYTIPGIPLPRADEDPTESRFRVFPDLDSTLADPRRGKRIRSWYSDCIRSIVPSSRPHSTKTYLCFIEKSFSVVGAIVLMAHLVDTLEMPATIYRAGYRTYQTRISGMIPEPGSQVILVYDVSIHGTMLREAAQFLFTYYDAHCVAGIVLYDFGRDAGEALSRYLDDLYQGASDHRFQLIPYLQGHKLDRTEVETALEALRLGVASPRSYSSSPKHQEEVITLKEHETSPQSSHDINRSIQKWQKFFAASEQRLLESSSRLDDKDVEVQRVGSADEIERSIDRWQRFAAEVGDTSLDLSQSSQVDSPPSAESPGESER